VPTLFLSSFLTVIAVAGSDDKVGRVTHITPKHTILECFDGEKMIIANRDIANARVRNFGDGLTARRRLFARVPVARDTPLPVLEALPALVKAAVEVLPQTEFSNFWLQVGRSVDRAVGGSWRTRCCGQAARTPHRTACIFADSLSPHYWYGTQGVQHFLPSRLYLLHTTHT
jgi:hypothetical protein